MKKIINLFILATCLIFFTCCSSSKGHYLYVLPILGEYYLDEPSSAVTISLLSDKSNPTLNKLTQKDNIISIGFNNNSDIKVTSFDIRFTDLSKLDNSFFLRNVSFAKFYIDFEISEHTGSTELTSMQILTKEETYSIDIGNITLHQKTKHEHSGLSLKSHLATTLGAGLTYYDVEYINTSADNITLTEINLGLFSQFPANIYINGELIADSTQLSYVLEPGARLSISIAFDEQEPIVTSYDVFLFSPLITVKRHDVYYELYAPYSTNGLALTGQELISIVEKIKTAPPSMN